MKLLLIVAGFIALSSCAGKQNADRADSGDSVAVSTESFSSTENVPAQEAPLSQESIEAQEKVVLSAEELDSIVFFGVAVMPFVPAGNDAEKQAWATLFARFNQLGGMKFDSVKRWYTFRYTEEAADEGGPAETSTTVRNEKELWLYDGFGSLRVYLNIFRDTNNVRGFQHTNKIYLYSGDSIVAGYEHTILGGQVERVSKTRIDMKQCPSCGMAIAKDLNYAPGFEFYPVEGPYGPNNYLPNVVRSRERVMNEISHEGLAAKVIDNGSAYLFTGPVEDYPYKYQANVYISAELYGKIR